MISIITINYNQSAATREFLNSCRQLIGPEKEVIVVDNASETPPDEEFQKDFPEVKFIQSETNRGFAGGNNLGMEAANGDYFCFLNNDVVVTPDLLEKLLAVLKNHPNAGGVSPLIRYLNPPEIIQYAGYTSINRWTGRNTALGKGEKDNGQFASQRPTAYLHGAAMMIPRKVVQKTGQMPEEFFLYYEEMDWCEQMRKAGFELWVEPSAVVFHHASLSVGGESLLWTYYYNRNRILFMKKNTRWYQFLFFKVYFLSMVVPRTLMRYLFMGKMAHIKVLFRAIAEVPDKKKRPSLSQR
ncbi:MAG: glycosyltransferase family 2 protein [Bacteroidia bacterium]|nr:glycosyltransferase family 2 protein [Bacteroidia bacterium]